MLGTILELLVILSALISAGCLVRTAPARARKTLARAFILAVAAALAFSAAQLAARLGLLAAAPVYAPLDLLSLLAVLYWAAFAGGECALFRGLLGD